MEKDTITVGRVKVNSNGVIKEKGLSDENHPRLYGATNIGVLGTRSAEPKSSTKTSRSDSQLVCISTSNLLLNQTDISTVISEVADP